MISKFAEKELFAQIGRKLNLNKPELFDIINNELYYCSKIIGWLNYKLENNVYTIQLTPVTTLSYITVQIDINNLIK